MSSLLFFTLSLKSWISNLIFLWALPMVARAFSSMSLSVKKEVGLGEGGGGGVISIICQPILGKGLCCQFTIMQAGVLPFLSFQSPNASAKFTKVIPQIHMLTKCPRPPCTLLSGPGVSSSHWSSATPIRPSLLYCIGSDSK